MELDQCACSGKTLARLLRPAVLALLQKNETHGYDIAQQLHRLKMFEKNPPDISGIYKVLNIMEQEGLVAASWELPDSEDSQGKGQPRRQYGLTSKGTDCLRNWHESLTTYRTQIDDLLGLIRQ